MEKRYDVFISYSSDDQKIAEGICGYLERMGYRCFVAYRDIPRGVVWAAAITDAIDESAMMVVVFSNAFNISPQTDREIELASENQMPLLTYRIADDKMTGAKKYYLKNLNWIDAFPHYADRLPDLLDSIEGIIDKPFEPTISAKKPPRFKCSVWIVLCVAVLIVVAFLFAILKKTGSSFDIPENGEDLVVTVNGVSFVMKPVEGGTFQMGSTDSRAHMDERPLHNVTVSSFYMGETEVTQALWKAVMGNNPSHHTGMNFPVEQVSWHDCQDFIRNLNDLTGGCFRLPTEAEWEYAARGGLKSNGYIYSGSDNVDTVAWYVGTTNGESTRRVQTKLSNELGLYDMSGNVWEWCSDWYGRYNAKDQINPHGALNGDARVLRGGSYSNNSLKEKGCRVSRRNASSPDRRGKGRGLRLVLPQKK